MATAYDIAMKQAELEQDSSAPVVAVENLRKTFGSHKVLNGISLSVSRGETLAVLGRSGTGKSVLLRLIIGLETARLRIGSHPWPGHRRPGAGPDGRDQKEDGLPVSACGALRFAHRC